MRQKQTYLYIITIFAAFFYLNIGCSKSSETDDEPIQGETLGESATLPKVTTVEVTEIQATTAKILAKITDQGNASITKRGICWNTTGDPNEDNAESKSSDLVKTTGEFETSLANLQSNTTYYVKAYTKNSIGTAYGETLTFNTIDATILPPANFPYIFAEKPEDGKAIYIPNDLSGNNFDSNNSQWSYQRSASSDNVTLFWEPGFGQYPAEAPNSFLQVDIEALLTNAEAYYAYYRDVMKFVVPGNTKSEDYRMMIFLNYQEGWLATGAGYDNVIGSIWINSTATLHPAAIAHEFGHAFQYQSHCDGNYGFRDQNYVGTFWEQCAQYMSWQQYNTTFIGELPYLLDNIHKNFSHEDIRYQSMYLMEYWKEKHGVEFLGKVWLEAVNPEHPLQAYMRLTGIDQEAFNDEVFEYACKNITWDYPLGSYNRDYINTLSGTEKAKYTHETQLDAVANDFYQINSSQVPQSYGYNAIKLLVPVSGTTVSVDFEGLDNDWSTIAGWRWGFVSVKNDGTPVYEAMQNTKTGTASLTIADNTSELWLVVTGAPSEHVNHVWDDNASNDENFPYKVKFNNTEPI